MSKAKDLLTTRQQRGMVGASVTRLEVRLNALMPQCGIQRTSLCHDRSRRGDKKILDKNQASWTIIKTRLQKL